MPLDDIGRTLLVVGLLIAVMGVVMLLGGQLPWLGRLPGDISIERGNFRFYAPLATCLLLSLILTLVLNLVARR
jgi:ABC-type tungstate transport system substrate-binding protein